MPSGQDKEKRKRKSWTHLEKLVVYPIIPRPGIGNQRYGMHFVTVDAEETFGVRDAALRLLPTITSTSSLKETRQGDVPGTALSLGGIRVKGHFDVGSGWSRWVFKFWHQIFGLRHCNFLPVKLIFTVSGEIVGQLCCILHRRGGYHPTCGSGAY